MKPHISIGHVTPTKAQIREQRLNKIVLAVLFLVTLVTLLLVPDVRLQ
jgi:hypothetical protein